jgi:hypothetical protein
MKNKTIITAFLLLMAIGAVYAIQKHSSLTGDGTIVQSSGGPVKISGTSAPLVRYEAYGGLCQYGECDHKVTIYDNGAVYDETPVYDEAHKNYANKITERKISPEQLADLVLKINTEDFEKIKQRKFEGTCPAAYDGSAFIYTFYKNGKEEVLDSCKYLLDQPLFKIINQISFGSGQS